MAVRTVEHADGTVATARNVMPRSKVFGRFGMRIFKPITMEHAHSHGHVEMNHVRGGRIHYIIDGEKIIVEANTTAVFWANVPHQLVNVEQTGAAAAELCNIYLPLDVFLFLPHIQELQLRILTGAMITMPSVSHDWPVMGRWYDDYRTHDRERIDIVIAEINAMFRRAALAPANFLRKPWQDSAAKSGPAVSHVQHVVAMVRHVLENIDQQLSNSDVTKVTGLHTNYALSLFSKTMQVSPKQFIIRMRLLKARAMLLDSKFAIGTIAIDCGFNSTSQFYEHFSKAYGTTPNRLRNSS